MVEGRQGWSTLRKLLRVPPSVPVVWERVATIPFLLRLRSSAKKAGSYIVVGEPRVLRGGSHHV